MISKAFKQLLNARVPYWGVMLTFLTVLGLLFSLMFLPHDDRGSDKAACIMNQRNMQQAVRGYENMHSLNVGDPIEWSKIIGKKGYIGRSPVCSIYGTDAYDYSPTIPPVGVLAAPCKGLSHMPSDTEDW